MSDQTTFNPQNRFCIAKGKESCPACVASMHSVRETESFATMPKELEEELGPIEEAVMGMCLITSSEIIVGEACNVSDEMFANPSLAR